MDPNTTLHEIREILDDCSCCWDDDTRSRLAEKMTALDSWMSKGGFVPTDWIANR